MKDKQKPPIFLGLTLYRERSHILPNWNSGVSKRNTVSVFRKTMELYEHSLCSVLFCKINCGQPSLQLALEVFLPTRLSKAWMHVVRFVQFVATKVFFFPNHKYTYYSPCGYLASVFVPRMLSKTKKKAKHNMNMHTKTPPVSIITSSFREKTSWIHQIPQWFMVSDMVILHIQPQDFKLQLFSP